MKFINNLIKKTSIYKNLESKKYAEQQEIINGANEFLRSNFSMRLSLIRDGDYDIYPKYSEETGYHLGVRQVR